jgi:hypothetical protein
MSKFTREDIQEIARGLADLIQESVPDRKESDIKIKLRVMEMLFSKYGFPLERAYAFVSSATPEVLRFILTAHSLKIDSV